MIRVFRLFRLPNLLIIVLTQFLVRYCIIMPAYITEYKNTQLFPQHLSVIEFILVVFATVIIAAGGYLINDLYDMEADEINKPGRNMVGKKISERTAKVLSYTLLTIGSIIGFSIGFEKQIVVIGFVFPFSSVSLYLYASYFKGKILTGNILIAILSSLSVLIIALLEPSFYINIQFVLIYAIFAFLISLIREVIKDAEDAVGDRLAHYHTFPVRFGLVKTRYLISFLILITSGLIALFLYNYFYNNTVISFWYLLAMFIIPFSALFYLVVSAREKTDYSYASFFSKILMLYGLLTIIPFYYYFLK